MFRAGDGDDVVDAGKGNDTIYGGNGDDHLAGGMDMDEVRGGAGDDTLYGGSEDDHLVGGSGDDLLCGGTGNDTLTGGSGTDTLYGGAGKDTYRFDAGDLQVWDSLEGTETEKYAQLDIIKDFTAGEYVIQFGNGVSVDSFADLDISEVSIDDELLFSVSLKETGERFLVEMGDDQESDLADEANFII